MLNNTEKHYLDWFNKADEDELNTVSILKHRDGTPSVVCFLSQQMAEKYLKGLLVYHEKDFPKIHDLIKIEELLLEFEPEIKEYKDELDLLNRYYIETRYPGDYPEFTWQEGEQAYEAAKKIKEFVLSKIV